MSQLEYTPDLIDFMPGAKDVDIVYELMLRQRDVALSETLEQLSDIGSQLVYEVKRRLEKGISSEWLIFIPNMKGLVSEA